MGRPDIKLPKGKIYSQSSKSLGHGKKEIQIQTNKKGLGWRGDWKYSLEVGLEQGRKINMVSMFRVSDLELVVYIYNP